MPDFSGAQTSLSTNLQDLVLMIARLMRVKTGRRHKHALSIGSAGAKEPVLKAVIAQAKTAVNPKRWIKSERYYKLSKYI